MMPSRDPDESDSEGTKSDSILNGEVSSDRELLSGDEHASDGGAPFPGGEAVPDQEGHRSPRSDDGGGGGKERSGEQASGGDVECPECGKFLKNDKSMYGHRRSHRNKGASPPRKKMKLLPAGTDGSGLPASAPADHIEGSSGQCSGRDPQLTSFEIFCALVMYTFRSRDNQDEQQVLPPPPPPPFTGGKLDTVDEETDDGIEATGDVAADVETEDEDPVIVNALPCAEFQDVYVPNKKRHIIAKNRRVKKKVKVLTVRKEKGPYLCKHCNAEFSTYQALGGHMNWHHREKKKPVQNNEETSQAHQVVPGQNLKGKQAKGDDESCREGLSLSSRRLKLKVKKHSVRRNDGTPSVVTPVAADGDQSRPLNIDLNFEAPELD